MTENEIVALEVRVAKGFQELRALCAGRYRLTGGTHPSQGRDWTMTIPAQDSDSDVVLYDALKVGEELILRERTADPTALRQAFTAGALWRNSKTTTGRVEPMIAGDAVREEAERLYP